MNLQKLFTELSTRPEPFRALKILQTLSMQKKMNSDYLLEYHDQLLFYKAYCQSKEMRHFCSEELKKFLSRVKKCSKTAQKELEQTGLAGTRMVYAYDYQNVRWLQNRIGSKIDIDWKHYHDRDDDPISDLSPLLFERASGDYLDGEEFDTLTAVNSARGKNSSLDWLTARFDNLFSPKERDHLYNSMNLLLSYSLESPAPSRTLTDDGSPKNLFLWNPAEAKKYFPFIQEILKPLNLPQPVSKARAKELHDLATSALLVRLREYYVATYADHRQFYEIPLERGINLLFWFTVPEYRLPLESGWGFILLKNNVPIGYGGGGLLQPRSEFALNIFETFRGGEAAWIYAQIARVVTTLSGSSWLVCRKYQVGGENNEEGLKSGSFWFYDKLGFRSVDKDIRKLADRERNKILKNKKYRSPKSILKKLAEADLVISLKNESADKYTEFPLDKAGLLATKTAAKLTNGDHTKLESIVLSELKSKLGADVSGWTKDEKSSAAQFGLFILSLPKIESWPKTELKKLLNLARAKGSANEADYVRGFQINKKFFDELRKISQ